MNPADLKPDPLQGHPSREWPSTPYSDEVRAPEPPLETSCAIALFSDCTMPHGPMGAEAHLSVRLRRAFPGQPFVVRNFAEDGLSAGEFVASGRLERAMDSLPRIDIAFVRFGIGDRKRDGIPSCLANLRAFCERLQQRYAAATINIETGIWVDYPTHYLWDRNAKLGPLYDEMRQFAAEVGHPVVDVFKQMELETKRGNWDLRVRGIPDPKFTIQDDAFDQFFGDDPAFYTNIHPNSRCLGLIAEWEVAKLKELFGETLPIARGAP